MRKAFIFITALCCLAYTAGGQERNAFEEIRQDPRRGGDVHYMYNHDIPAHAAAPRGYKPFYITHYGRHGARNHSSDGDFDLIYRMFSAASQRGQLTERGKEYLRRYGEAYKVIHGRSSDLTDRGFEQQFKIAHNMYRNYSKVFRKDARIDAVSTTVPRCILTMSAFCDQMLRENPRLRIEKQASEATMYYLNPFTLNNPDVKYTDEGYNNRYAYWQKDYQRMLKDLLSPEKVFGPLFKDIAILTEFGNPIKLETAFFSIAKNAQDNGLRKDDLLEFIPYEELCMLYEAYNFRFYVSKGADTLYQKGRQWAFSWRTVQDMLDKADEDLQSGEYAARLRFGHDIIIMSVLALLDVDGYNKPVGDIRDAKKVFFAYDFPMSLNLQFIFYRNNAGDIIVRPMYNERDIELPIPDCGTRYYYRWEELRKFWVERIDLAKHIIATTQAPPKVKNY